MKKWLLLLLTALCLTGCSIVEPEPSGSMDFPTDVPSTSTENILMGNGEFAYYNGFIYFAPPGNMIAEVDLSTMKVATFEVSSSMWIAGLEADSEHIYFTTLDGRRSLTTDGKTEAASVAYSDPEGLWYRYNQGTDSFYIQSGLMGDLYYEDLETHEVTKLLDEVAHFGLDGQYIYAVANQQNVEGEKTFLNNGKYLYRIDRETFAYEIIHLVTEDGSVFKPIKFTIVDNVLYADQAGTYQLYYIDLETIGSLEKTYEVTALPMQTLDFRVIGNQVFYVPDDREEILPRNMYIYNLETGETSDVIFEDVYVFCVVADRYVCVHTENSMGIYDAVKGEHLQFLVTE